MRRFLKPKVDDESNDPVWVMPDVPEIAMVMSALLVQQAVAVRLQPLVGLLPHHARLVLPACIQLE